MADRDWDAIDAEITAELAQAAKAPSDDDGVDEVGQRLAAPRAAPVAVQPTKAAAGTVVTQRRPKGTTGTAAPERVAPNASASPAPAGQVPTRFVMPAKESAPPPSHPTAEGAVRGLERFASEATDPAALARARARAPAAPAAPAKPTAPMIRDTPRPGFTSVAPAVPARPAAAPTKPPVQAAPPPTTLRDRVLAVKSDSAAWTKYVATLSDEDLVAEARELGVQ